MFDSKMRIFKMIYPRKNLIGKIMMKIYKKKDKIYYAKNI